MDAAASVEEKEMGKEEKEKLFSTKEAAETLKGEFSSRSGSSHPLLGQEIRIGSLIGSVWQADLTAPYIPTVHFQRTELRCIAQVRHNLD